MRYAAMVFRPTYTARRHPGLSQRRSRCSPAQVWSADPATRMEEATLRSTTAGEPPAATMAAPSLATETTTTTTSTTAAAAVAAATASDHGGGTSGTRSAVQVDAVDINEPEPGVEDATSTSREKKRGRPREPGG